MDKSLALSPASAEKGGILLLLAERNEIDGFAENHKT